MPPALFLGIDVGTQSLRAALFDRSGTPLAIAAHPLTTTYPHPTWAEQEPDMWWQAICAVVPACLAEAGVGPEHVAALALDNASCTVVAVDRDGRPVRPALLWMDQRAHREAAQITATNAPSLRYAGRAVSPEFGFPKALWLRANEPEAYARTAVIGESIDWLNWRLTGRWASARNNATCKWNYIPQEGGWPVALLEQLGAGDVAERLPGNGAAPLAAGALVGELTTAAAQALGLRAGTPVAQGAIDAYAAVIGMNALRPGQLGLILGTSSCHMAIATDPIFGSGSWGPYPDALAAGTWILEGGQTASGSIVRWIEQTCGNGRDIAALDAAADAVGPGAQGLLALDYWQGNRSPRQDPLGRGVFVGLTLSHEVGHMLRAVYEATAYGTRHIVEDMVAHGFAPREVVACGGGTRSRLWLQLHADICQLPIVLTTQPESTALGAAMCAAVGAGAFGSLTEAGDAMVQMQERIEPSAGAKDVYDRRYAQYLAAYERLQPLMHQLAAEQSDVG